MIQKNQEKQESLEKLENAADRVAGKNQHKNETPTKSTPTSKKLAFEKLETGEIPGQTVTDSKDQKNIKEVELKRRSCVKQASRNCHKKGCKKKNL